MKYLICCLLLLLTIPAISQTKKETEDWLTYYLNKYFSVEDRSTSPFPTGKYVYVSRKFFFRSKNLVALAYTYESREGEKDSLINQSVETIQLDKVIKVYCSKKKDSVTYLNLDCVTDSHNTGVIKTNATDITDDTGAYNDSYVLYSSIKGADKVLPRVIKALNHLVILDNGKLLKEVF